MAEKPILFSAPMVLALIDGSKTQTRRLVKPQPIHAGAAFPLGRSLPGDNVYRLPGDPSHVSYTLGAILDRIKCPYAVGDRLWVREAFWHEVLDDNENVAFADGEIRSRFDAGTGTVFHVPSWEPKSPHWRKRPSIHMPRWASRITLVVTEVRVQRLQEISEEDALAEGVDAWRESLKGDDCAYYNCGCFDKKTQFRFLWGDIHGTGAWDANPWVFAYTFEVVE